MGRLTECEQMNLGLDITGQIEQWAIDRGFHNADHLKQMLKLMVEVGELAKNNPDAAQDAIGDAYAVPPILSMQLGMDISQCVIDEWVD